MRDGRLQAVSDDQERAGGQGDAARQGAFMSSTRETASLGQGLLALTAGAMAAVGASAAEIAANMERRRRSVRLYIVLDTLEYLKRGGRISAAQAAIGSVLSVKPIITIEDGVVETVDRPRTRGKARARLLELFEGVEAARTRRHSRLQGARGRKLCRRSGEGAEVPARRDDRQPGRSIGRAACWAGRLRRGGSASSGPLRS